MIIVCRGIIAAENGDILLVQRACDSDYYPAHWEFPGGKAEAGEGLSRTLLREVKEETRLDVELVTSPAYVSNCMHLEGRFANELYAMFFGICTTDNRDVVIEGGSEFTWTRYDNAKNLVATPETAKALLLLEKQFNHYRFLKRHGVLQQ